MEVDICVSSIPLPDGWDMTYIRMLYIPYSIKSGIAQLETTKARIPSDTVYQLVIFGKFAVSRVLYY